MQTSFSRSLSLLRQEKGVSQRMAARELGISQALLSHYENGVREPGLAFVVRACEYYDVSADFLLGRTMSRDGTVIFNMDEILDENQEVNLTDSCAAAHMAKKLLINSTDVLFDLLEKTGRRDAIRAGFNFLAAAIYTLFRYLYRADGRGSEDIFAVSRQRFASGAAKVDMFRSELEYADALEAHSKGKGMFPDMSDRTMTEQKSGQYKALLQIIFTTGRRITRNLAPEQEEE